MRNYEVTFIVDPVLSGDEIKATAQTYVDTLKNEGCTIVHVNEMGLRQLAYPINRRTTGVYYCVEFQVESGDLISRIELALRRDERIMRFLTYKLDKYGVKYNEDKRAGKIGTVKKKAKKGSGSDKSRRGSKSTPRKTVSSDSPKKDLKKSPVKADALKTQASVSLDKKAVDTVVGEEE